MASDRAKRAFEMRQAGATYAAIGKELGVSGGRIRQLVLKAERTSDPGRRPWDGIVISNLLANYLEHEGFHTWHEVVESIQRDKRRFRNLGPQASYDLKTAFAA